MRKNCTLVICLAFLNACWSSNDATTSQNTNVILSNDYVNAKIERVDVTNSKLIPYKGNINPKAANGGQNANVKMVNRDTANNKTKFEERPAPDNSVFESKLDSKGYTGTRTFKDHPLLLKIEQTQLGKDKKLKVYLKNGKVYDVSEEKVPNFRVNSPSHILAAIGILPKTEQQKGEISEKKEKSDNEKK